MATYAVPVQGASMVPTPTPSCAQQFGRTDDHEDDVLTLEVEYEEEELDEESEEDDEEDHEDELHEDEVDGLVLLFFDELVPSPGNTYSTPHA